MDSNASIVKVPTIPVVVKKGSTLKLLKNNIPKSELLMRCIKLSGVTKDQLIYKSAPGDFLRGEFPGLTLVSRLNLFNQTSSTVASYIVPSESGRIIEKTSNEIVKVIGQSNYDTVFSALCSVISQELRIRALLALLTVEESSAKKEVSAQTEKSYTDFACQTDETSKSILENFKQRKRIRRQQFRPYIVKEDNTQLKRVVIDPKSVPRNLLNTTHNNKTTCKQNEDLSNSTGTAKVVPKKEIDEIELLPELSGIVNEDSNFSDASIGNISLTSQDSVNIPQLLHNPNSLIDNVDNHTKSLNTVPLTLLDESVVMVCAKPADKFHWATPDILKNLCHADQHKLMLQQAFIHWKYCLERDEDGYLPIHHAVMSNDLEFLMRQCAALNKKYGSVDIPSSGNMTALQMSLYKDGERCTAALLQSGADPCLQDDEGKTFFHTAAEISRDHLNIALDYCRNNARAILKEDEDMWNPVMEHQDDEQLAKILLDHICIMCDNQGYTPLMLASKQGNDSIVHLLLEASPDTVNRPMPNSGSTALYLAVEAACYEACNGRSTPVNRAKVSEKFLKTIEMLMESGGNPSLENHFGSSVNLLLTEFNIVDLSVLIANKLTSVKFFDGMSFAAGNINSLMLYKNSEGKVGVTQIRTRRHDEEAVDVIAPSSSTATSSTAQNSADSEDDAQKEKRMNTAKVSTSKSSGTKVEIKEIKTIKAKKTGADATPGKKFAVPAAPASTATPAAPAAAVKASHIIIVPKNSQPKSSLPKYVKILPKPNALVKVGTSGRAVGDVKGKQEGSARDKGSAGAGAGVARKNKKNADRELTPAKRQRTGSADERREGAAR